MQENINVLDELNKGSDMGLVAIDYILDKIGDKDFRKGLKSQYLEYKKVCKEAERLYSKYSDDKPHKINDIEKIMSYYGIEMRTITDKSDSKYAELLLKGTNMGIIEGRKLLNNKNVDKKINKLLDEFVSMQEKYVEFLKKYL